jgi:hypothetical protein
VLGWRQNNLNCWIAAHQFVHHEEFNPEQNWTDCEVVLKYLTQILGIEVTFDWDDHRKVFCVLLNYVDIEADSPILTQAICIAAIGAILYPEKIFKLDKLKEYIEKITPKEQAS